MDTHSRNNTSQPLSASRMEPLKRHLTHRKAFSRHFAKNLFISVGTVFLLFVLSFCIYQYRREKIFKTDIMHSRLQMYIYEMRQSLGKDITNARAFRQYISRHYIKGLRVTVTDSRGRVIIDSHEHDVSRMENHLSRHEIQEALSQGNGYDIKRFSESTHETYFYSAAFIAPYIVRVAVPYSAELTKTLQVDRSYIWYAILVTIIIGIILYHYTSRIGNHIGYLREFAVMAENGEELDHELERRLPDDELGDISHTIITLYWKLRHSEEERIRIKRQLTQNAAHELKTPAASIHGYLESILSHPDMPQDKRQHFLERCYAQSERMTKLLLDMAALTKLDEMEQDGLPQRMASSACFQYIDITAIIHAALDDTALQLHEHGISVHIDTPPVMAITGDQSLIYSIFRNIIDNTIAYATGADTLTIKAHEMDNIDGMDDKTYSFMISDNGPGVEPQHLQHIFERFYRVDKGRSRKLGGTGLGLAIVKNAVMAHGGTCAANTTLEGGLTISFTLTEHVEGSI